MRIKTLGQNIALSVSLLALFAAGAHAATATSSLIVTATVLSVCTIVAGPLAFGNYSNVVLNASATLSVACTVSSPYNVSLDVGSGNGATITTRRMTNGASTLQYRLFSDAARSVNIGQTIGTDTISGTGNGLTQTLTIYGQILPNQLVTPGIYSDTVTATITY